MNGLKEAVEGLGGNFILGGTVIQFSDANFMRAFTEIYEAGAMAEREACAKLVDECVNIELLADAIRARGNHAT